MTEQSLFDDDPNVPRGLTREEMASNAAEIAAIAQKQEVDRKLRQNKHLALGIDTDVPRNDPHGELGYSIEPDPKTNAAIEQTQEDDRIRAVEADREAKGNPWAKTPEEQETAHRGATEARRVLEEKGIMTGTQKNIKESSDRADRALQRQEALNPANSVAEARQRLADIVEDQDKS